MTAFFSSTLGFGLEKNAKVVVVGGGIAGLTVAYRLQNGGMDVDLYEARSRVGGRIFTAKINGRIAELGGQNISDGGEAVNLKRLIDEFGLECNSNRAYLKHSYFDGENLIPIKDILKKKQIDPEILKKELHDLSLTCSNIKEILENIIDPQDPLYKILAVRMAAYEGGSIEDLSPLYAETLLHMLLGGLCSVHQAREEDPFVDVVTIRGGNSLLPQRMSESLGSRLHLNMPLTQISKNKKGSFQLSFQNGEEVEADILVLAIPCSTYEQIIFANDVISSQKLEAIRNVQYGANAKIIVPFTTMPRTTGIVGNEFLCFFDYSQQLLTIYYTGKTSLFSPATITNSYRQARPMIEKGFENDCPLFIVPTYAKDHLDFPYDGPVGYSWPNDPYVRGTYSYIAKGQEKLLNTTIEIEKEIYKTLFAPIQQSLYFVGEHTSILSEIPGTMEAACESGERIARAILQNQAGNFREMIVNVNNEFYNESGDSFDKIPFDSILPELLMKYGVGQEILEIGSGAGALASWLIEQGYQVSCIEPAERLAKQAKEKGLKVYSTTIQSFNNHHQYDNVIAISSLIHLSKADLPSQIQRISRLLKPHGVLFVSFIEGNDEGFEDPTKIGKLRYFAKWNEDELNDLFSPYFTQLESHKIYNKKMDRTFLLKVYTLK